MDVTGIILAGGESKRMGSDKGLKVLNGKPMVNYVIDLLEGLNIPILIVANNDRYTQFGYTVIKDQYKNKGPLGGIHAGISASETEINLILGCDAPFLDGGIISKLMDDYKNPITIAKFQNRIYPLIGLYNKSVLPELENAIEKDVLKLTAFCEAANSTILDFTDNKELGKELYFANLNSPKDIKAYEG